MMDLRRDKAVSGYAFDYPTYGTLPVRPPWSRGT